ncbi:MAG: HD domain-containing protein [Oscillospiraceae bacterium]|jgi:uncharacterized protein|nr:HD domain-containing protein [Oscillospiraceae bacterium]
MRDWLNETLPFLIEAFASDFGGHDVEHTLRVYRLAMAIWEKEGGDGETIALAALLHDVDDYKLTGGPMGDTSRAEAFMAEHGVSLDKIKTVTKIIAEISFKSRGTVTPATLEGKIVQDADRLDAIGAVGIARTFAYGGSKGRPLYIRGESYALDMTAEEYAKHEGSSVGHFYEKLLKLKGLMNTETAKQLAAARHQFMEDFLAELSAECFL